MFHGWEQVESHHVLRLLQQIMGLFSNPDKWIDFPLAENIIGIEVKPLDKSAIKWSLMGACELFASADYPEPICSFVGCATREYINDWTDDELIRGHLSYQEEFEAIKLAYEELNKELSNEKAND